MTISAEQEAQILRYFHVEKWRVGTIASQLAVHHYVVERVLVQAGNPKATLTVHPSKLDVFLPFILETLAKYPRLCASRLYQMVRERGYTGGSNHFRHWVALHRPRKPAEAYLRLRTLPGEQAQVDWAQFSHVTCGRAKRPLMAFVMVLSYSRKIFLHFCLNARMANFLNGHVQAFAAFGGIPRVLLFDNLKSAVLERQGDAIRFNPTLLAFSAYYRFEPRPVAVARGNEKGRVERAIRYVRDNFFAARTWTSIDDLNAQAKAWCEGQAADRPCPEDLAQTVRVTFEQEQPTLIALPDNPYPCEEREEVRVGKTPYVRFDLNDYSVPHTEVGRYLTVIATAAQVRIVDGATTLATHPRSYNKLAQIEQDSHINDLVIAKRQARYNRGQNYLTRAVPASQELLKQAASRGYHLRTITSSLLQLLDDYGVAELTAAIIIALQRDVPHPNAVRLALEKARTSRNQLPPIKLNLPNDKRIRELVIHPHALTTYDTLNTKTEETTS